MARCMGRYVVVLLIDLLERPATMAELERTLEDNIGLRLQDASLRTWLQKQDGIPQGIVMKEMCEAVNKAFGQSMIPPLPMKLIEEAVLLDRRIDRGRKGTSEPSATVADGIADAGSKRRGRLNRSKAFDLEEYEASLVEHHNAFSAWRRGLLADLEVGDVDGGEADARSAAVQSLWLGVMALICANELSETRGADGDCQSRQEYDSLFVNPVRRKALGMAVCSAEMVTADIERLQELTKDEVQFSALALWVRMNGLVNLAESIDCGDRPKSAQLREAIEASDVFRRWEDAPLTVRTTRNLVNLLEFAEYVERDDLVAKYEATLKFEKLFRLEHLPWRQAWRRR